MTIVTIFRNSCPSGPWLEGFLSVSCSVETGIIIEGNDLSVVPQLRGRTRHPGRKRKPKDSGGLWTAKGKHSQRNANGYGPGRPFAVSLEVSIGSTGYGNDLFQG